MVTTTTVPPQQQVIYRLSGGVLAASVVVALAAASALFAAGVSVARLDAIEKIVDDRSEVIEKINIIETRQKGIVETLGRIEVRLNGTRGEL